jgi:hypothetical protein
MMGSPFMPPFATPGPAELAAFLWVVNPGFIAGTTREATAARDRFLKTCRVFVKPAQPALLLTYRLHRWEKQAGVALGVFTRTVAAARAYMEEALQDKPPSEGGGSGPDYYSDFCHISAALMRNYPGMAHEQIQSLPLKVLYQFLKEIREQNAAMSGQTAVLWNGSDEKADKILELLNTRN